MKILTEKTFDKQLIELQNVPFEIKSLRGFPSLEQTKRNKTSRDLIEGLYHWLFELLDEQGIANVVYTNDGIAIEVENQSVLDGYKEGNGYITLLLNLAIPNLGYDSMENLRDDDDAK
jgi:hypothetical protein